MLQIVSKHDCFKLNNIEQDLKKNTKSYNKINVSCTFLYIH